MPEYLAPRVYVEEVDTGSKPIEGVGTSTAGFIGVAERGPVDIPILVTSYGEFTRWFGGRLSIDTFRNGTGALCYLPHAVEGFFTNGGQRVYVTRVLDTTLAVNAGAILFDRGSSATATVLFRTAGEATGTPASPPQLYLLDKTARPAGVAWFRVGDGSAADYVQLDGTVAAPADTFVPLDFPLARSHQAGKKAEEISYAFDNVNYTSPLKVVATGTTGATARGASTLVLAGTGASAAADVAKLIASPHQLLEIGDPNQGEYRFALKAVASAGGTVTVTLDSGLVMSYANNAKVSPLELNLPAAAKPQSGTLGLVANAGDPIAFLNSLNGVFNTTNDLVVFDSADLVNREARRIGALSSLPVSSGAYAQYPRDSVLRKVTLGVDDTTVSAPAPALGATSMKVADVSGLAPGMSVTVGPTATSEMVLIQSIAPDAAPATSGTITFTPALANGTHTAGSAVSPPGGTLTAPAAAGSTLVALDSRLGLSVGDIVRVGLTPDEEYLTVAALPAAGGVPPDSGNVVLAAPLARAHPLGAPVRRQLRPSPAALQPTVTFLPTDPGATVLLVTDGTGFANNDLIQLTTPTGTVYYHRLTAAASAVTPAMISSVTPLERAHLAASPVVPRDPLLDIQALDAGAWGNRLRVAVEDEPARLVSGTTLAHVTNPTHIRLASAAGVEAGTVLEFTDPLNAGAVLSPPAKVIGVNPADFTITLAGGGLSAAQLTAQTNAVGAGRRLGVRSREFRITVWLLRQPDPALPSRNDVALDSEMFRYLSMDPRHSRYAQTVIGATDGPLRLEDNRHEGGSWYVRVHDRDQVLAEPARTTKLESVRLGPETLVDVLPDGRVRPARRALEEGDDSVPTITEATYVGLDAADPRDRTGLFSLMNVEEISIIACPGRTSAVIQGALIAQCELMRYRFAVLDGPPPPDDAMADVLAQRQQFDTKYAALYYPWLLIEDPYPKNLANVATYPVPPAGHVVGVYARTDNDRGVHKAPANEVVSGILGLRRTLYNPQQDILNPYPVNINVIRDFRHYERGIVVYGVRVITSDSDWKYVPVRRLLIFIEASIDRGLQWVVFEPNAEPLWARVKRSIVNFLTQVWRDGALEGTKPEEAFYVKCDRTTMTQTDIDNGRLIILVGVAPVKPAEFVIVRIGLWTAQATT